MNAIERELTIKAATTAGYVIELYDSENVIRVLNNARIRFNPIHDPLQAFWLSVDCRISVEHLTTFQNEYTIYTTAGYANERELPGDNAMLATCLSIVKCAALLCPQTVNTVQGYAGSYPATGNGGSSGSLVVGGGGAGSYSAGSMGGAGSSSVNSGGAGGASSSNSQGQGYGGGSGITKI